MSCPCGRSLSYVALVFCDLIASNELASFLYCEVAGLGCCISLACVHCCPPLSVSCASWGADLFMLCADALRLPCLSCCARLVEVMWHSCWVFLRYDSSHVMSLCTGLLARAGELIALLCVLCVFFGLLVIFDVESALAAASAAVGSCCLLACGRRRLCHVASRGFPTVGRRGGRPRRPCRALSMGRVVK